MKRAAVAGVTTSRRSARSADRGSSGAGSPIPSTSVTGRRASAGSACSSRGRISGTITPGSRPPARSWLRRGDVYASAPYSPAPDSPTEPTSGPDGWASSISFEHGSASWPCRTMTSQCLTRAIAGSTRSRGRRSLNVDAGLRHPTTRRGVRGSQRRVVECSPVRLGRRSIGRLGRRSIGRLWPIKSSRDAGRLFPFQDLTKSFGEALSSGDVLLLGL